MGPTQGSGSLKEDPNSSPRSARLSLMTTEGVQTPSLVDTVVRRVQPLPCHSHLLSLSLIVSTEYLIN